MGSPLREIATWRAIASAVTLSDAVSMYSTRLAIGGDATLPSAGEFGTARPVSTFSAPSASASAFPAAAAGSSLRGPSWIVGSVRPPSSISALIGATSPLPTSAGSQLGASSGPVHRPASV